MVIVCVRSTKSSPEGSQSSLFRSKITKFLLHCPLRYTKTLQLIPNSCLTTETPPKIGHCELTGLTRPSAIVIIILGFKARFVASGSGRTASVYNNGIEPVRNKKKISNGTRR